MSSTIEKLDDGIIGLTGEIRHGQREDQLSRFAENYLRFIPQELKDQIAQLEKQPQTEQIEQQIVVLKNQAIDTAMREYHKDYPDLDTPVPGDPTKTHKELFTDFLDKKFNCPKRDAEGKLYYQFLRSSAEKAVFDAALACEIPASYDSAKIASIRELGTFYSPERAEDFKKLVDACKAERNRENVLKAEKMKVDWVLNGESESLLNDVGKMSDVDLIANWPKIYKTSRCLNEAINACMSGSTLYDSGRYPLQDVEDWHRRAEKLATQFTLANARINRLTNPLTAEVDDTNLMNTDMTVSESIKGQNPALFKNSNHLKGMIQITKDIGWVEGSITSDCINEKGLHKDYCQYFTLDGNRISRDAMEEKLMGGTPVFAVDASQPDKEPLLMQYSRPGNLKTGEEALQAAKANIKKPSLFQRMVFAASEGLAETMFGTEAVNDIRLWKFGEKLKGDPKSDLKSERMQGVMQKCKAAAQKEAPDAQAEYRDERNDILADYDKRKGMDSRLRTEQKQREELIGNIKASCLQKLKNGEGLESVAGELIFCSHINKTVVAVEKDKEMSERWEAIKAQPDKLLQDYKKSPEYKNVVSALGKGKLETYLPNEADRNALLSGDPEKGMQMVTKLQSALIKEKNAQMKKQPKDSEFHLKNHLKAAPTVGNVTRTGETQIVEKSGFSMTNGG